MTTTETAEARTVRLVKEANEAFSQAHRENDDALLARDDIDIDPSARKRAAKHHRAEAKCYAKAAALYADAGEHDNADGCLEAAKKARADAARFACPPAKPRRVRWGTNGPC